MLRANGEAVENAVTEDDPVAEAALPEELAFEADEPEAVAEAVEEASLRSLAAIVDALAVTLEVEADSGKMA